MSEAAIALVVVAYVIARSVEMYVRAGAEPELVGASVIRAFALATLVVAVLGGVVMLAVGVLGA